MIDWIANLFTAHGIAQSILVLALVIATGMMLGKIKIAGISFGVTWILFVGIAFSHFGVTIDEHVLHFVKEFGLILFVYSVGLQVGPSFFSSFKKGGLTLNMLAMGIVLLGVVTTYIIYVVTGLPITTMVGILSGAVTNTPGLGAAQQAYTDMTGANDPTIALGYAVAYPLGVVGIIASIILVRAIFRVNMDKENAAVQSKQKENLDEAQRISVLVSNPAIFGMSIKDAMKLVGKSFIISRVCDTGNHIHLAGAGTRIEKEYKLLIVGRKRDIRSIVVFFGQEIDMPLVEWEKMEGELILRKAVVTKPRINGKSLSELKLGSMFNATVTRVTRAGVDLVATPDLHLQIGDRVTLVGSEQAVEMASKLLGDSVKHLREPNLIAFFIGITLGVLLGSIPFVFPGVPQPIKLGLAGGPLIVAILLSRFGPQYKLITYTTTSANLMLREIGIALFLACVGLGAGSGFVETIVNGGAIWIAYGFIITVVPLLLIGIIGRLFYKLNYFTLMGLMAGSTTDPPALAYANSAAGNGMPAVSYATVYPLTMFLRVLTAQLLILFA